MSDSGLVFVIDGSEYPAPTLDTLDMQERVVLFELANVLEEELLQEKDETDEDHNARYREKTRHPGFMMAMMHIAYARGNPDVKRGKVQELIERTNFWDAIEKWGEATASDADPPSSESTSEPSSPSLSEAVGSHTSSGPLSSDGSEQQVKTLESIGTGESDTSPTPIATLSAV